MTSLIFASVNHVAHVEPCDDAEEGVGGHGSFALTMESAITKTDESRRLRIHEVMTIGARLSRERGLNRTVTCYLNRLTDFRV